MKRLLVLLIIIVFMLGGTALAPALSNGGEHMVSVTKIGFIGDSITAGAHGTYNAVQNEISVLGKNYEAVNRGMNGSATADWLPGKTYLESTLEVFKSEDVKIVSVMLGVNDAVRLKTTPEQYTDNMRAIVEALLKDTAIRLVVINYPTYVQRAGSQQVQIAKDLEGYMKALDGVVDGRTIVRGDTEAYAYFKAHPDELVDGTHPTDPGYKTLGGLWATALQGILTTRHI